MRSYVALYKTQTYRKIVQFVFLAIIFLIGIKFAIFVYYLEKGITPPLSRPPGVEAFLPISALISLKYWLATGIINEIHPSALVLLVIIVAVSFLLKKGFCSWVCPIGLVSEYLARLNSLLFKKRYRISKLADYLLRSIKYVILLFFIYAIFWQMDIIEIRRFIYSPYNKVADIKMLKFFSEISNATLIALAVLTVASIVLPYFWCRYLCPYGALAGLISFFSPFKIHRNKKTCISCGRCNLVCPANLDIQNKSVVYSDECHACYKCVNVCPAKGTLYFSIKNGYGRLSSKVYALIIVLLFVLGISLARLTDVWQNKITLKEYLFHIKRINTSLYHHNRGQVPDYDNNFNQ